MMNSKQTRNNETEESWKAFRRNGGATLTVHFRSFQRACEFVLGRQDRKEWTIKFNRDIVIFDTLCKMERNECSCFESVK